MICFLDDVLASPVPVVWQYFNTWQLVQRAGGEVAFTTRFGVNASYLDFEAYSAVRYGAHTLTRYAGNRGMLQLPVTDPARATVLATATGDAGEKTPWAVRSGNLIFVSEIPFAYMAEGDRMLVFADLLFDVFAPSTPERHRAIVRLEDISIRNDPDELRAVADYLESRGVPFGFGIVPEYRDPFGHYSGGTAEAFRLDEDPEMVAAIRYLEAHGGTMVMHGWTHQWDGGANPYTGVTADDTEFFRLIENPDGTITFAGALPEDSFEWAFQRIAHGESILCAAGFHTPTIFEFPHYAASPTAYAAAAARMPRRWERSLYFSGQLGGGTIDATRWIGQMFPYVVRDLHGATVLPENLGNVEPTSWAAYPARLPAAIVDAAERTLAVRDGVAGVYFHPFYDLDYLRETVEGMQALGYEFVSPSSL